MQHVCAWCRKVLGGSDGLPRTHGVCADCSRNLIPVFLDTLEGPVLLIGADARAQSANAEALKALAKDLPALQGEVLGHVFDCINASMPGGCGKTPRCHGCSIRATVEDTFRTGTPHDDVHALLKKKTGQNIHLNLSTRKVKEGVLVTIKGQQEI